MSEIIPISPALKALYDDERAAPVGGDEDRARIRARVLGTIGIGAGVGGATGTAGAATTPGAAGAITAATITGKIVVLALALGALGGGLSARAPSSSDGQRAAAPPAAPMPERAATAAAPLAPSTPAAIAPLVTPVAVRPAGPWPSLPPRPAPVARVHPRPVPSSSSLAAGAVSLPYALLSRAHAALQRGEAQAALELLERDRTASPESTFAEEREALRVVALRRLHRHAEARAVATAFDSRYPGSIHRPLVDPARQGAP